ncbi:MAG: hypothetical protein KAG72_07680, partial [Abyssibacter sp.]|nr:hypothetical protein [Abyssibacter sp.]
MTDTPGQTPQADPVEDENKLIAQRREKLAELRQGDTPAFPNDFRRDALAADLHGMYGERDA